MLGGNGESFCGKPATVPHRPTCCERQIVVEQMNEAALEAAADVGCRNIMTAELDALSHAGHGLSRTGEPEVVQFDFVSKFPCAFENPDISPAAQRAFQGKRLVVLKAFVQLREQQSRGPDGTSAGSQRGKSTSDFIGIQEAQALHLFRKEFLRERGLTRAVAAGNQVNRWQWSGHSLSFIPQTTPARIVWRRRVADRPVARRGR